ncbi:hypothetical protein ACSBOB_31145 [Mesorhizobium sp. ASY16-5R]|jgi:hypothetical protein|uniref:hypothetical protein n=1 Tax=Mesorhizobium sp. ASY16-5R TaxID=3445772 RepID=UPI003FA047D5
MNSKSLILIAVSATLCGCSTLQDDLKNKPERMMASCVRQVEAANAKFKEHAMTYMGVRREGLAKVFCERLAAGVADGRITQYDVNELIRTGQLTSKFAFLKG